MSEETYSAAGVLAVIADTFVGTDHEDWLRYDTYTGDLRLGNLTVKVVGNKLVWRDLGFPRNAGEVEIPDDAGEEDELPDGSYIEDVVDEVSQWLLTWTDDLCPEYILDELHCRFGGGKYTDTHGDPVIVEQDGLGVWGVSVFDESLYIWACHGSIVNRLPNRTVEVLWDESFPIDPEMIVTGYQGEALDEALEAC